MFSSAAKSWTGGLFNQSEGGIHCDKAACVCLRESVCVCPPILYNLCMKSRCACCFVSSRSLPRLIFSSFTASVELWEGGLVGFPPQVSLSPTSLSTTTTTPSTHPPPSVSPPPSLSPHPQIKCCFSFLMQNYTREICFYSNQLSWTTSPVNRAF